MQEMCITRLREMLEYSPESGKLIWKVRPRHHFDSDRDFKSWNSRFSGKEPRYKGDDGYLRINILGFPYLGHRIIWAIYYGYWPEFIDHIDNNPSNNSISNLRECTHIMNCYNRHHNKNNKSGYKGVSWHSGSMKWRAVIMHNRKQIRLGYFDNPKDAHKAYVEASRELHKDFAKY